METHRPQLDSSRSTVSFRYREGVEMVPGTVYIVDSAESSDSPYRDGDVVLVPQPTNDPEDPLNWRPWRKEYHFWLLMIWGVLAATSVNWNGPVWNQLAIDLNTDINTLNITAAVCFGCLGIGTLILQPLAMKIGRRPVYIFGTLLNFVGCILGGVQKNVQVFFAVNALTGFGSAPVDSLVQISATDVFFAHERGTRFGAFALGLAAGSYLGPVAAGYIGEDQTWRWAFWYLVILFGAILILQVFTQEETLYRRPLPESTIIEDEEVSTPSEEDKGIQSPDSNDQLSGTEASTSGQIEVAITTPATYWQRIFLTHTKYATPKSWWRLAIFPFRLVTFPSVVWTGIILGVQIMWLSLLSVTQAELFGAPPYNFGIAGVGNTNIAAFVGSLFGMLWGGPLSDWYVLRRARQNKGFMEPEFRLWLLIAPAIINTAGLLMYGLGAYRSLHWIISAGIGTGFIGFGVVGAGAISLTYAVDCYPGIAAESMVLIVFLRNVLGFAFTFAIQQWIDGMGGQGTTIVMAAICLVTNMSFLVLTTWGKNFRKRTSKSYLRMAEERAGPRGYN